MATVVTTSSAAASPPPAAGFGRWTSSIPTNLINLLNPFAVADDNLQKTDNPVADAEHHSSRALKKRPAALGSVAGGTIPSRQSSPTRSAASSMFDEPDNRSTSEEGSVDGKERLRKNLRSKSRYSICHAPPASSTRQKLHRRPRALLQLHKLSSNARPRPAFEVIPSAHFSVRLTRAVTKVFTARHGLCVSDLVVLKAENYNVEEEDEEEELRDVIGLICKSRKDDDRAGGGKARIYMACGSEWEAYTTMSGAYEFSTIDKHGLNLTARWVPKKNKDGSKGPGKDGRRKFNFSTISANSRRHPVIATLSGTGLDINDTYRMPDPTGATPLSTPQQAGSALAEAMEEDGERELCETDDRLREVITLTSIWVAFKEGWSPTYKYDDKDGLLTPASPTKSFTSLIGTPPTSPCQFTSEKRRSLQSISSGLIRRTSVLSKRTSSLSNATADDDDVQNPTANAAPSRSASLSGNPRTGRTRADSNSTVLVHRAASNRRKNNNQHRKSLADLLAAHNQLQEVSREDLPTRDGTAATTTAATDPQKRHAQYPMPPSNDSSRSPTPALPPPELHGEKRESTTTSDTTGYLETSAPSLRSQGQQRNTKGTSKKVRKSGSWRRLLCGTLQDQK